MRQGLIMALALACTACSGSGDSNEVGNQRELAVLPSAMEPMSTFVVRGGGGANACRYELELRTVDLAALDRKSREILDTAIGAAGGIDHMRSSQIPYINLRVDPQATFSCLEPVLTLLRDRGYSRFGLKPDDTAPTPHFVHFPLTEMGAAPPTVTVAITADGRTTWNGEAVDLAQLGARARTLALGTREAGARGILRVVPDAATRFSAIYDAVRTVREYGIEPDMGELLPPRPGAPGPANASRPAVR